MFRAGVLVLLVAAATASYLETSETVYKPGKNYRYKYESQVLTGAPNVANEASGLKMRCEVSLQVSHNYKMVMQLESVELYKVSEDLAHVSLDEPIPESVLSELPREEEEALIESLSKPVEFRYENGEISKVMVSGEEPYFTVNIKKGILNLLSLDLTERKPVEQQSYRKDIRNFIGGRRASTEETDILKVWEESTVGECETLYSVYEAPSTSVPELLVSKVVDVDKCKRAPLLSAGILSNLTFTQENTEKKNEILKAISAVEYKLNGDRRNYLIKEAELSAKYALTPTGEMNGDVASFIRQKLILKEIEHTASPVPINYAEMVVKVQPLMMELPIHLANKESFEGYPRRFESRQVEVLSSKVYELLGKVESLRQSKIEETPAVVEDLVLVLRELPSEEIIEIVQKLVRENRKIQKEVILDVLPTLTTPQVVPVVIEIIKHKIVSSQRAQFILNMVALTVTPTPEVVKMLLPTTTLYREAVVREDTLLRHTMYLTLGSIVHRMRELAHITGMKQSPVYTELARQVVSEIKETYYNSELEDKVVILKAIANAGLPEFIPVIKEVISTEHLPTSLRILAIFTMRRMPENKFPEVQKILLPVFLEEYAPSEVRISAYLAIMHTEPGMDVLRMIAHIAAKENNKEVVSYIYRHMTAISRSEIPARIPLKMRVLRVIKFARPAYPSYVYNTFYSIEALSERLGLGAVIDFNLLKGESSLIHEHVISKIGAHVMGMDFSVVENGLTIKGMRDALSKLIGPESVLEKFPEYTTIKELIRKLLESESEPMMHNKVSEVLFSREHEQYRTLARESPVSLVRYYLTVLGNELRTLSINEELVLDVLNGRVEPLIPDIEMITEMLKELRRGMEIDTVKSIYLPVSIVTVPTPLGIPLNLNLTSTIVSSIKGSITVENIPTTISELMSYTLPEEITAEIDVVPEVAMHVHGVMGIDASFLKAGAMIRVSSAINKIPISIKAAVNTRDYSIRSEIAVPQESSVLFSLVSTPSVFIIAKPRESVHVPSIKNLITRPIVNKWNVKPVTVKVPVPVEILGVDVGAEVHFPTPLASYSPVFLMNGQTRVNVVYAPFEKAAKTVEFKVAVLSRESPSEGYETPYESRAYERSYRTGRQSTWKQSPSVVTESEISAFEEVTPSSIILSPVKQQIYAGLKVKGEEERSIRGLVSLIYSTDLLAYQVNTQLITPSASSPEVVVDAVLDIGLLTIPTTEISQPKLVSEITGKYFGAVVKAKTEASPSEITFEKVNVPAWVYTLKTIMPSVEIIHSASGAPYSREQKASRSLLNFWPFANSVESKESRRHEQRWEEVPEKRWEEESEQGWESSPERRVQENDVLPAEVTAGDRYYITEIEYENITPEVKQYLWAVDSVSLFAEYIAPYARAIPASRAIEEGKVVIKSKISPILSTISLLVETPIEADFIVELPYPSPVEPAYRLIKSVEQNITPTLRLSKPKKEFRSSPFKGECRVHVEESREKIEANIETFDEKVYRVPYVPKGCDVILASDCSNKNLFSILLQKGERMVVAKILTGKDVLEVEPTSRDWIIVRHNGKEHTIPEGETLRLKNAKGKEQYELSVEGEKIKVHHVNLGVALVTDFKSFSVQVSPWYKGEMCGLCGDYDSKTDSFISKSGKTQPWFINPEVAPIRYLVPMSHETCDIEDLKERNEEILRRMGYDKGEGETCAKIERTYKTEMEIDREKKICFSIKPIPACPSPSCEPIRRQEMSVQLHCLDAKSESAKSFASQAESRVLRELSYRSVEKTITIEVPSECAHRGW